METSLPNGVQHVGNGHDATLSYFRNENTILRKQLSRASVSSILWSLTRLIFVLFIIGLPFAAQATSFDCTKASTQVEKTICATPELSELDDNLGEVYEKTLDLTPAKDRHALVSKEIYWLEHVRDRCASKECLIEVYKARLNSLDPFYDNELTCAEMANHTRYVFTDPDPDLGSGANSPLDVNYDCSQSIASRPFMKKLLGLAETIRGADVPQMCSGTIVDALWRYYQFDLTEAGFAPGLFAANGASTDEQQYFKQWAELSPYNYRTYRQFISLSEKTRKKLVKYYETSMHIPSGTARGAAQNVINAIGRRAAGAFQSSSLLPESALVRMARDPASRPVDVARFYNTGGAAVSPSDTYRALKTALLHKRSAPFVSALLDHLTSAQLKSLSLSGEPLLSFALQDHALLELLLQHSVPVNAQNPFGKTAIFYAIQSNNLNAVRILIAHGANINHAYKTASELRPDGDQCIYPDLLHTGRTPLMHAAQNSNVAMLKLLVKHGARLGATDDLDYNALDYAYMAKNNANEAYLRSLGMEQGHPVFPFKSPAEPLDITNRLPVPGNVSHLTISPARPTILVAAVGPWSTTTPSKKDGIYFLSLKNPGKPRLLSHFPSIKADAMAVSPDGNTVYALQQGKNTSNTEGIYVINASNPAIPRLRALIHGNFYAIHLSENGEFLYIQGDRTLVYQVSCIRPKELCQNPFLDKVYKDPIVAYSFESLPAHRMAIRAQGRGIYVFRTDDPCKAEQLFRNSTQNLGIQMAGLKDGTLVVGSYGLTRYRFAKNFHIVGSYSTPIGIQMDQASFIKDDNVVAALFSNQISIKTRTGTTFLTHSKVGILKMVPNGHFVLKATYWIPVRIQNISSLLLSESGHLFLGVNGGLITADVPVVH